ncbi:hypothetical protein KIN20_035083 [Parelaphostrongylus tenuis]|uniref:Uncharacterized protein n=1 Tax=Parelaphostrongylus tenuis TaxID=148309 RepID=A0AAD5RB27_PARTN|nr:hypothetical protein KIN20_035083 [Parelaphostrongylus tenuis]
MSVNGPKLGAPFGRATKSGPTGYHPLIRKQWAAFGPPKEAAYQITDSKLRANFSDSTLLSALYNAAET